MERRTERGLPKFQTEREKRVIRVRSRGQKLVVKYAYKVKFISATPFYFKFSQTIKMPVIYLYSTFRIENRSKY